MWNLTQVWLYVINNTLMNEVWYHTKYHQCIIWHKPRENIWNISSDINAVKFLISPHGVYVYIIIHILWHMACAYSTILTLLQILSSCLGFHDIAWHQTFLHNAYCWQDFLSSTTEKDLQLIFCLPCSLSLQFMCHLV